MTPRPTPLASALAALAAAALLLAILLGRPEFVAVAVPGLVALLAAGRPAPDIRVETALSETRLVEGGGLTITLVATNAGCAAATVELLLPVPPGFAVLSGAHHVALRLAPGGERRLTLVLCALTRGRFQLGEVHLRITDAFGLRVAEARGGAAANVEVYPPMLQVRHLPHPRHMRATFGNYVAPGAGEGLEPAEIRAFAPGDSVRRIHWPASLRHDRLHVATFHPERNADVVVLLDSLAETGARPQSSLDRSIAAAGAIAAAYLARNDRVGLIDYGGYLRWVAPATGRRQLDRITAALVESEAVFSYAKRDLDVLPRRVLPVGAIVIAVSPLLDERFTRALLDAAGRSIDLVVLAVSPIEATRGVVAATPSMDLACRLWRLDWEDRAEALGKRGIPLLIWHPPEESLEAVLASLPPRMQASRATA